MAGEVLLHQPVVDDPAGVVLVHLDFLEDHLLLDVEVVLPQRRERVFFVGFREDMEVEWSFPEPTHSLDALLWSQGRSNSYWDKHQVSSSGRALSQRSVARLSKLSREPDSLPWL